MEGCLFCRIASKKIPSAAVYEDDEIFAFDDIHPQAPVHVLIIPKLHFASLNEADEDKRALLGRLLIAAREIAKLKGVDRTGYRVVFNTGPDSGQEVLHIHAHLLGGRRLAWPPG
jgi:histidine triad (HIT) family protein